MHIQATPFAYQIQSMFIWFGQLFKNQIQSMFIGFGQLFKNQIQSMFIGFVQLFQNQIQNIFIWFGQLFKNQIKSMFGQLFKNQIQNMFIGFWPVVQEIWKSDLIKQSKSITTEVVINAGRVYLINLTLCNNSHQSGRNTDSKRG